MHLKHTRILFDTLPIFKVYLAIKTVGGCRTTGESEEYIARKWRSMQARINPSFETQGRPHQKPKTGAPVALQKDWCKVASATSFLRWVNELLLPSENEVWGR